MIGDRVIAGKPKPINKRDYELVFYCGGMGGGTCYTKTNVDRYTWYVENDPEAVVNRYLALEDLGQFELFTDGGQTPTTFDDPACRNAGTPVPLYVGVSVDGNPDAADIIAQNVITGFGIPALIEFDEKYLPQPTNPLYEGRTYITVYWGNVNYVQIGSFFGLPYRTEANLSNVEI